jgi:multimeric flavodoxin WrbA
MNILAISTTTHAKKSTSRAFLSYALQELKALGHEIRYINANDLHIVDNLSCYADGKFNCASFDAGQYRCWAHKLSAEDPKAYGGVDEMPIIYEGIAWADAVLFSTSVRWGSHSALLQKIIERLNTLENRKSVYGEQNPLDGKKCGVIVSGHNAHAQQVSSHLLEMFSWIGFETSVNSRFVWQKTSNLKSEVGDDLSNRQDQSDSVYAREYLLSEDAVSQMNALISSLTL